MDGHCIAIGFPLNRVNFIGINPPDVDGGGKASGHEKATAMHGVPLALEEWDRDPHGRGPTLLGKRKERSCWDVSQKLFFYEEEEVMSGVETRWLSDGSQGLCDQGIVPLKTT